MHCGLRRPRPHGRNPGNRLIVLRFGVISDDDRLQSRRRRLHPESGLSKRTGRRCLWEQQTALTATRRVLAMAISDDIGTRSVSATRLSVVAPIVIGGLSAAVRHWPIALPP
jgi:hypothetical protein